MGDYGELIIPNDSRWDVEGVAPWVERSNIAESQRKWVVKLFEPIKDKCIGLLEGNHEVSIRTHNYQDIYLDICRDLGVQPLGYSCFVRFIFNRARVVGNAHTFIGAFQHGSGAAQTEGGVIMRLKKLMDSFDADIYAMGHIHRIKSNTIPQIGITDSLKLKDKVRVGCITGGWMRGYSQGVRASYVEQRGMYPTVIGCPYFEITPDKNMVKVVE